MEYKIAIGKLNYAIQHFLYDIWERVSRYAHDGYLVDGAFLFFVPMENLFSGENHKKNI